VGEPPLISSPAAICAAMRGASGRELWRIPVRPEELAGISQTRAPREVTPGRPPA
jgi:CO/xanthine dehydrogenase Mo-binding subunit